jgi:hypothetical protein
MDQNSFTGRYELSCGAFMVQSIYVPNERSQGAACNAEIITPFFHHRCLV